MRFLRIAARAIERSDAAHAAHLARLRAKGAADRRREPRQGRRRGGSITLGRERYMFRYDCLDHRHDEYDEENIAVTDTATPWQPPLLWRCPRCSTTILSREAGPRCPRCGAWEDE